LEGLEINSYNSHSPCLQALYNALFSNRKKSQRNGQAINHLKKVMKNNGVFLDSEVVTRKERLENFDGVLIT